MSVPSQPAEPQRPGTYPGATPSRPPTADTALSPPILPHDQRNDDPNPPHPQDALPQTGQADPPRTPRLGQPPRGNRLAPKNGGPAVNLTAQQRLLLRDT